MRKFSKVLFILVLAAVLALSALALTACGGKGNAGNGDNDGNNPSIDNPEKPGDDKDPDDVPEGQKGIVVSIAKLGECKIGDEVAPAVTVKEDGKVITAAVTIAVTDPDGEEVAVTDGKFKTMVLGAYTVTAKTATGESATVTVVCKPAQTQSLAEKVVLGKNRDKQVVYFTEAVEQVFSVTYGGEEVAFTLEDGKAVLETEDVELPEAGTKIVSFVKLTDGTYRNYSQNFEVADWAIGTAEEFSAFGDCVAEKGVFGYNSSENPLPTKDTDEKAPGQPNNTPLYAVTAEQNMGLCVLTDDIDYEGADFNEHTQKHNFFGTLDGRGHTLYNVKSYRGLFFSVAGEGNNSAGCIQASVIKNLSLVNFRTDNTSSTAGLLAYCIGFVNIDNCYFQGVINSSHADSSALGNFRSSYMAKGSQISNVVVDVRYLDKENKETFKRASILVAPRQNYVENVYCVSPVEFETIDSKQEDLPVKGIKSTTHTNGRYKNIDSYATYEEFAENVDGVPLVITEYANKGSYFNDYWTIQDGMLMFKSAAALLDTFNAEEFTVTDGNEGEAYAGEVLSLASTKHNTLYKVEGLTAITGYTIDLATGSVKLGADVATDTEFTVIPYYFDVTGAVHEGTAISYRVAERPATEPDTGTDD